jgi:hypothetical protein
MTFEITEKDFLNIVQKDHCLGTETPNGTAKEGHPNCESCKGNYFVGGECNRGGSHLLTNDLKAINQNFKQFESLLTRQIELSNSKNEKEFDRKKSNLITKFQELEKKCGEEEGESFFYGSCIVLDGTQTIFNQKIKTTFRRLARELRFYIDKVEKTTWEQLQSFNEKLNQLEKMQSDATSWAKDLKDAKDRGDKSEELRLLNLLSQTKKTIASLRLEIKNNPNFSLFSEEQNNRLENIVENIFRGEGNFFNWNEENDEDKKQQEQEKYLGIIPKKWGKVVVWIGIALIILTIIYLIYQRIIKKIL